MTENDALGRLAQLAGIEDGWWDFFGEWRPVPAETKRAFLAAMGFHVAGEDEILASLHELESRPWHRWLEPVVVLDEHGPPPGIALTLPAELDGDEMTWEVAEELGVVHRGAFHVHELAWCEERDVDGRLYRRRWLHLPEMPPVGYHTLTVRGRDQAAAMAVIVAPACAHVPEAVAGERKAWGVATQIYSLRSAADWGVGTYAGLAELAAGVGRLGGASVGINPLHALFGAHPDRFSPYAPSSRRFLNTAYIDVEAIPEFGECRLARRQFAAPGFQAALARLRFQPLVEYLDAGRLVRPILEALYHHFRDTHWDDERGQAFRAFQVEGGRSAERFATFEALHEKFTGSYWRQWPEEFRHPDNPAVARFIEENRVRVEFFHWLQWVADTQLALAQAAGKTAGMAIGLYRDLGVGIAGDGAEAWAEQDVLALGPSVGAPPDPLALKGQDWGLVPFNPLALRERAYEPFIQVMRANMRHAGAMRLDHAMSLQRLYWVPPYTPADQGAYVRYPVEDLFRLVALESRRNRCLVIGEDLGTVPEGFRERMDRFGVFAYRVMVFEKADEGFRKPGDFDDKALAIFATHDLPSARGWWGGVDIAKRIRLDLYPRPEMGPEEHTQRATDRHQLVRALVEEGLLAADFPTDGKLSDPQMDAFSAAAHAYLERCRSRLLMVQIEDVLGLDLQMNLPGTTDQHPNWRARYPVDVATLLADPRLLTLADRLKTSRGG